MPCSWIVAMGVNKYIFKLFKLNYILLSLGFCYECGLEILQKTEECHLCRKVINIINNSDNLMRFFKKIKQVLLLDLASKNKGILKVSEGAKLVSCSELEKSYVSDPLFPS